MADPNMQEEASAAPDAALEITVIEPPQGWMPLDFAELWRYRELFGFLVWRDVKVKYKQTLLGFAWAVLVPFAQMVVFSLIFGRLAGLPSDGLPRPIFYYAALLPWTYFATALAMSSNSLVSGSGFLTKIYFPRVIIPMGPCLAGVVDFALAFLVLLGLMFWLGVVPASTAMLLPLLLGLAVATAMGCGMILSALNVKYRDVRYVVPFIIQIWMYCTVIIPFSQIPADYGPTRYLYGLNPMAGVIEGFRWCLAHHRMSATSEGPLTLSASDILDPERLVTRLRDPEDPLSVYLMSRLPAETRTQVVDWDGSRPALAMLRERLSGNMTVALRGESIYTRDRFAKARLTEETKAMLGATRRDSGPVSRLKRLLLTRRALEGLELKRRLRLNRRLLREAYPLSIGEVGTVTGPVEPPWTLLAIGSPVTALLLIFGIYYFKRTEKVFADVV